jgi:prepilin-type N-terminal cleavage/methylation domain-containing protein/prepilin-type processing-associated H-X9-DG protein
MRRTIFTLIELLVVIAIIAILAAMLLPALNKARQRSMISNCQNSQKQIALAMFHFIDDQKGLFPFALQVRGGSASGVYDNIMWEQKLFPYIAVNERNPMLFVCPAHREWSEKQITYNYYYWFASTNGSSYGYNGYYLGLDQTTVTNANFVARAHASKVRRPAATILTGERGSYVILPPMKTGSRQGAFDYWRHLNGAIFSFVDGHVKWYESNKAGSSEVNNYLQGTNEERDQLWSLD